MKNDKEVVEKNYKRDNKTKIQRQGQLLMNPEFLSSRL